MSIPGTQLGFPTDDYAKIIQNLDDRSGPIFCPFPVHCCFSGVFQSVAGPVTHPPVPSLGTVRSIIGRGMDTFGRCEYPARQAGIACINGGSRAIPAGKVYQPYPS